MKLLILIYSILLVIGQKTLIQDLPIIEFLYLNYLDFHDNYTLQAILNKWLPSHEIPLNQSQI